MKTLFTLAKRNRVSLKTFLLFFVPVALGLAALEMWQTLIHGDLSQAAFDGIAEGDTSALIDLLVFATIIIGTRAVISLVMTFVRGIFYARTAYSIRRNFASYFLHLPFALFEKRSSGENLSLYTNDRPNATYLLTFHSLNMVQQFLEFVVAGVFMLFISPFLTLVFFVSVPVMVVIQSLASMPIQKRQIIVSERMADYNAIVTDSLQNVSTIAAYSLEDVLEKRYLDSYEKFVTAMRRFIFALLPLAIGGLLLALIPFGIVNTLAANRVIGEQMSIAEFVAFSFFALFVMAWLMMLSQRLSGFQSAAAGAKRLLDNTEEGIEDTSDTHVTAAGDISFKNVSFAYNGGPNVVSDVSFDLRAGSKVAIVGGSGSGKSTLMKLLLGAYKPAEGEIMLGDNTLASSAVNEWRSMFAYVPQDSFLFPISIGENIAGLETQDLERLEKSCREAGIYDFVQTIGFDGVLSESADNVSGGQKQRIALARAFYKDAPVILFDEATSALDPVTEGAVLDSLRNTKEKTIVMVAHRARAVAFCDMIIVMDNGKLCGMGTHDELIATSPTYKNLYEASE